VAAKSAPRDLPQRLIGPLCSGKIHVIRLIVDALGIAAGINEYSRLTISVVNPTFEPQRLAFRLDGARLATDGTQWVLIAADGMAYNESGKPPVVRFVESHVTGVLDALEVPPASATIFRIAVRRSYFDDPRDPPPDLEDTHPAE
jgi:hypothetical protein